MSTIASATTPGDAAGPARSSTARTAAQRDRSSAWPAWVVGILFVLPVLWMVLTSFHTETDAATNPPTLFAPLTLEGYQDVLRRRARGRRCSTR